LAQALECRLVLAAGSRLSGGITPAEGRKMTADGLNACMPLAEDAGVTLAIEDFGVAPTLQCAAKDCIEVMDSAPGVAFVFDTGNFYFADEDPLANFDALASRTCHVHLKDWVKSDRPQIADVAGAPLGEGIIPNREVVARFLESTHVDSYSLEVGATGDTLEATRRDLATLQRWLG
jgi:sugar phosphate isomerase/epimerase